VALKAFRTYPTGDLREAEKVSHAVLVNVALIFATLAGPTEGLVIQKRLYDEPALLFPSVDMTNSYLCSSDGDWTDSGNPNPPYLLGNSLSRPNSATSCLLT